MTTQIRTLLRMINREKVLFDQANGLTFTEEKNDQSIQVVALGQTTDAGLITEYCSIYGRSLDPIEIHYAKRGIGIREFRKIITNTKHEITVFFPDPELGKILKGPELEDLYSEQSQSILKNDDILRICIEAQGFSNSLPKAMALYRAIKLVTQKQV